jgi:hypothetical protein
MTVLFNPYQPSVELNSTALDNVPGSWLSSDELIILKGFMLVFPKHLSSNGGFCSFIWKINSVHTVGILKSNLKCKGLIIWENNNVIQQAS